eukprot:TRINITY_DN32807_c0_g1_i1.p1 TRINITY_DN32807_c0_g1~~TRINITY_DN32807_c0_g1_i1.p1  ORF type:complete len:297 (+),score=83.43 TRINITY_DN32807_c0_g1_i1:104-892(+)
MAEPLALGDVGAADGALALPRASRKKAPVRDQRLAPGPAMLSSLLEDDGLSTTNLPIFPIEGLPGVKEDHVRDAFQEIDLDRNDHIGVSELRYVLALAGENPTDEELDEMIGMLDDDGDGQVAYKEFLGLFSHDSVVLAQMLAMRPEGAISFQEAEKARKEAEASGKKKGREKKILTDDELKSLCKAAVGLQFLGKRAAVREERAAMLPKFKAKAKGQSRARPISRRELLEKEDEAAALLRRQQAAAKAKLHNSQAASSQNR